MRTVVYVISDLHLGGTPGENGAPGFQICPASTQTLLASFVNEISGSPLGIDRHLVVAGDIVDFLAVEPFAAFTPSPSEAQAKLDQIFRHTKPVWDALQRFVTSDTGTLTILLGNHDIELALPSTRRMLLERLGRGRVNFVFDNEAFVLGRLLVEHGNRFDAWNAVSHGALRRARSQASRQVPISPAFPAPPGSRLVVDVLNPLKKRYPFVDLLKPEDAAALPILAALGATGIGEAWRFFTNYRRTWAVDYDEDREPLDEELIADSGDVDQAAFELATSISTGVDEEEIAAIGETKGDFTRDSRADALFRAFRAQRSKHLSAFDIGMESETYLAPARRAASAGFEVIVYGHTHLAKRVRLGNGEELDPVYLNTGTWADLMRVPEGVWHPDDGRARLSLSDFLSDLERGILERWRRPVPTYARIDMDNLTIQDADVCFCDTHERLSTEGLKRRLDPGANT